MRYRRPVTLLIVVSLLLCLTGCGKKLSCDMLANAADSYGIKKAEKLVDFKRLVTEGVAAGSLYLTSNDYEVATDYYNRFINTPEHYPKYDLDEVTIAVANETGSDGKLYMTYFYMMTFEDEKKAEKVYDAFEARFIDDVQHSKRDKKDGITYAIEYVETLTGEAEYTRGVYMQGKTVLVVSGGSAGEDGNKCTDEICNSIGVVSPLTLKNAKK